MFFPPPCWYEDYVGVYMWQTSLEALIIVVVCVRVGLWSSGLCELGSRSISFTTNLQDFGEMGLDPLPWCVFKLTNRCDKRGHFVWQPQEDEDTSVKRKQMPAVTGFTQVPPHWWLMVLTFCSLLWRTLKCPLLTRSSTCGSFHPFEATSLCFFFCLSKNSVYLLASNLGGAWLKPRSVEHLCRGSFSTLCVWLKWPKFISKKRKKQNNNNISEVSWSSNQHRLCFAALMMMIVMIISCVLVVKIENLVLFQFLTCYIVFYTFWHHRESVAPWTYSRSQMSLEFVKHSA